MSTEKQKRVFVVDDEEVIARTIAVILNGKGFEATAFADPLLAKECERNAPKPSRSNQFPIAPDERPF